MKLVSISLKKMEIGPPEGVLGDEGEDDGEGDGEMQPGNVGGKERRRCLGNQV